MLKTIAQYELTIEGKTCRFICESDTALSIIKEFNFQFSKYLGQLEDQVRAQQEALKVSEKTDQSLDLQKQGE